MEKSSQQSKRRGAAGLTTDLPLHRALAIDDDDTCQKLIAAGADVNEADRSGKRPLHLACQMNNLKVAALLIKAGANVNAETTFDVTALHLAAQFNDAMVALLLKEGAAVNAADSLGMGTPLHAAAHHGKPACASLLLTAGADVHMADKDGNTALHCAAETGKVACGLLLLQAGARPDVANQKGNTPLHVAVVRREARFVALLAPTVPELRVPPEMLRVSAADRGWLGGGPPSFFRTIVENREARRRDIVTELQGESRWRRRRPLALIREQRRAVRDAGMAHKQAAGKGKKQRRDGER